MTEDPYEWMKISTFPKNDQLVNFHDILGDTDTSDIHFTPEIKFNYQNPSGQTIENQKLFSQILDFEKVDDQSGLVNPDFSKNYQIEIDQSEMFDENNDEILALISANRELSQNKPESAGEILKREITDNELSRGTVSQEKIYNVPESLKTKIQNQQFKYTKDTLDEVTKLLNILNENNIKYKVDKEGENVTVTTGEAKYVPVIKPRKIITEESMIEKMPGVVEEKYLKPSRITEILKLLGLETSNYLTTVNTAKVEQLKKWGNMLDLSNVEGKTGKDLKKEILEKINQRALEPIRQRETVVDVDEPIIGQGVKRAYKYTSREKHQMIPFGRYQMDLTNFNKKGVVHLKTSKNMPVYRIGQIMGSSKFNDIIKDIIKNQNISMHKYKSLKKDEQKLIDRLIDVSDIDIVYVDKMTDNLMTSEQVKRRFMELYGSFSNGNDSIQLKNKINEFLDIMLERKIIDKKQALKIQHSLYKDKI